MCESCKHNLKLLNGVASLMCMCMCVRECAIKIKITCNVGIICL